MSIKVNIPSYLQPYTNDTAVIEVGGGTLYECLKNLSKKYPKIWNKLFDKAGELHGYVSIYLDGEFIYGDSLSRAVNDGDEFHIFYILGGG
jgi:molybdopterin converting factor small subunit